MNNKKRKYKYKRVLICGSRDFNNKKAIRDVIKKLRKDCTVIEGGAPGADTLARKEAIRADLNFEEYVADWKTYGPKAGPYRNFRMIKEGKPEVVFAFFSGERQESRGTMNMVMQAKEHGIPVIDNIIE